ncbi:MAG TPA: RidA family protein [Roseiarcus sp.]|nr:RidA family protein [Roseiarcus sp.]
MLKILQPKGWAKPAGYANGVSARGRIIHVAGQIGWNKDSKFETDDFVGQVRQSLRNVVAVLACDGAGPEHIVSMTWYFTSKREYLDNLKGVGEAYRETIGRCFPAMTAVEVAALIEDRARVEIQAVAVAPDP